MIKQNFLGFPAFIHSSLLFLGLLSKFYFLFFPQKFNFFPKTYNIQCKVVKSIFLEKKKISANDGSGPVFDPDMGTSWFIY
jgi:hypothetical protein